MILRRILPVLLFILVFAGAASFGFFSAQEARLSWFDPAPALKEAGKYNVRLVRDRFGVAHIYGAHDADVAFGLGYAQSQDAFDAVQRAFLRARGRLALVDGRGALQSDYLAQALGFADTAKSRYGTLSPQIKTLVEAYAAGVNLYAAEHRGQVLSSAAPVEPSHVVALFMYRQAYAFGLEQKLGALLNGDAASVEAHPTPFSESLGVALGPTRSAQGATRLMISTVGDFAGPDTWREVHVQSDEGWVMHGGTLPGTPLVLQGMNDELGWALGENRPQLADTYRLVLDPENPNRYRFDTAWRTLDAREKRFDVRLWGRVRWSFTRSLLASVHGPVLRNDNGAFAVRYAGMNDVRGLEAFYRLNKAKDFEGFQDALRLGAIHSLSFAYADKTGRIAGFHNALYPDRGDEPSAPERKGDVSSTMWRFYRPFAVTPKIIAPRSGLIVAGSTAFGMSAGADELTEADILPSLGLQTSEPDRIRRARSLFASGTLSTAAITRNAFDLCYAPDSSLATLVKEIGAKNYAGDPVLEEAGEILRRYSLCTEYENRGAALAIITTLPLLDARVPLANRPAHDDALSAAASFLLKTYGRLDPEWGEVNRFRWGAFYAGIAGAPGTMRAIGAGTGPDKDGMFAAKRGAGLTMLATWQRGRLSLNALNVANDFVTKGDVSARLFVFGNLHPVALDDAGLYREALRIDIPSAPAKRRQPFANK